VEILRGKVHLEDFGVGLTLILHWFKALEWGGTDWIDLTQDKNVWQGVVKVVMNLLVPNSAGDFVTN
jgi:hypothetical protein